VQTPAPFEYEATGSIENALAVLERHGPEGRPARTDLAFT
jgi:hypothetical protein